ncbi:MAG: hypothetical protein ACHQRK_04940 [Gemmatimonadales bacterium]
MFGPPPQRAVLLGENVGEVGAARQVAGVTTQLGRRLRLLQPVLRDTDMGDAARDLLFGEDRVAGELGVDACLAETRGTYGASDDEDRQSAEDAGEDDLRPQTNYRTPPGGSV